jgi:hypothetical protein
MEPTDKSIPPVNITKVTPIANMALIEVCVKIVIKFVNVKNLSEMTESTAIKIISANTIAYFRKIIFIVSPAPAFEKLFLFIIFPPLCSSIVS